MTDSFVQEDPGPARTEHHFHRTSRRIDCTELQNGLPRTLMSNRHWIQFACEDVQRTAATAALITDLAIARFFGDAHDIHPNEGLKIPRRLSVRRHDKDMF